MKYEKVNYQMAFVIGPFLQRKLGAEIQLEEGDTPEDAWADAHKRAVKWNSDNTPEGQPPHQIVDIQQEAPIPEDKRTAILIGDIKSCTELKVLESYRILAKTKPELQAAYDEMIEKLTPKK